ncbi:MAG: ATP-binding cassette domain-containing protein [Candidatus Dojkabacteria bacterium]|nr:ATP-binding cassette domain-containing protein [Candidatus Dojkabacteria bacterium]
MKREVSRNEIGTYKEELIGSISVEGEVRRTKRVLEVNDLVFDWGASPLPAFPQGEEKTPLINGVDLEIYGNEKIWLVGPNGTGKSTFIKLLVNELKPVEGAIKWGENLKWKYFSQNQEHLPMEMRVDEYFMREANVSFSSSFGQLEKFLFDKDLRSQKIGKLSPGQRARLSFAIFTYHEYDCLILDEPTNHLDIKTKEVIEEALREFKGAMILISHDRYFSENIGPDRVVTLEEGELVEV